LSEVGESGEVIPDPIRRLSEQAGAIDTAKEMLAIPNLDSSENEDE
jgi:hypothetical protein